MHQAAPATTAARGLEPDDDGTMSFSGGGPLSGDRCPSGAGSGWDSDQDESCSASQDPSLDDAAVSSGSAESAGLAFLQTRSTLSIAPAWRRNMHAFAAHLPSGTMIGHRFQLLERIGKGSFGAAYRAVDLAHGRSLVALKVARSRAVQDERASCGYAFDEFLGVEVASYSRIGAVGSTSTSTGTSSGIPQVLAYGKHVFAPPASDGEAPWVVVSFLAMQLLGQSVWQCLRELRLFEQDSGGEDDPIEDGSQACGGTERWRPSRAWVCKTGKGMLKALAACHAAGHIHRDVKTENFCLDASNDNGKIFVCDFGFARMAYGHYAAHLMNSPVASFWGTPDYASLSALKRLPQTPRDDLEALVYCLVEMEQPDGRLPWHGCLTNDREAAAGWSHARLSEIANVKRAYWNAACKEGLVPGYLQGYAAYITSLGVCDVPDYSWLAAQLDSGVTGLPPRMPPRSLHLRPLPSSAHSGANSHASAAAGSDGDAAWARDAVLQVSVAASAILDGQPGRLQLAGGSSSDGRSSASRVPATEQQSNGAAGSGQQRHPKRPRRCAPDWASADGGEPTATTAAAGCGDGSAAAVDEHALHAGSDPLERKLLVPITACVGGPHSWQQQHQAPAEAEPLMAWPELDGSQGSQEFY